MEAVTLDLMYHIPSDESITECEITKDLVEEKLSIEEQKLKTIAVSYTHLYHQDMPELRRNLREAGIDLKDA